MRHLRRAASLACAFALMACDDAAAPDPCTHDVSAGLEIGTGVGGTFVTFADGQEVGLASAPQGGFGVTILVRTQGLDAGPEALATLLLETLIDGEVVGEFENPMQPVACTADGGLINGIVVGFDPNVYKTNDDLLALDGQRVELRVTVTDASGEQSQGSQIVTIRAGG